MCSTSKLRFSVSFSALLCLIAVALSPVSAAVEVGAGGDRYSGSGALLLPGGVDSGTRHEAASCTDCRWRLSDPCSESGGPCLAVTRGCAQLAYLLRLRLSLDGGATWSDRGLICIPPSGPVTITRLADELQSRFVRLVPDLAPRQEPAQGIVTQIPVNFISGHPEGLGASRHDVLGHAVVLHPTVRWSWQFGDGARLDANNPGHPYPNGLLRHAYRSAGSREVRVDATWSGTFEVDGLGPFSVAGVIRQTATWVVSVGEGRAVLVP